PTYPGKFHYSSDPSRDGACQFTFNAENCILTPASGTPLVFDLGDVDLAVRNEWDLQLELYTGRHVTLRQFGAVFDRMAGEFIAAWRDRSIHCMLLEDLAPVGSFNAAAAVAPASPIPAEVRIFKSNIAVLPLAATPYQWRLASIDSISFNSETYAVTLKSGDDRLVINKLAKKTEEFREKLQEQYDALRQHSAEGMHQTFPFLDPDRLGQLLSAMPEGRSVAFAKLAAIHAKLPEAIVQRAVNERLRPYFNALRDQSLQDSIMVGYKFIREDEVEDDAEPAADSEAAEENEQKAPLFFWFFFPLARPDGHHSGVAAWEASTGSGRATYFFRTGQPGESSRLVEGAMQRLTQGLAVVNFRREPVYLSDESLNQTPKFNRYAIGCRKMPVLRDLRAAFVGRAIHAELETWSASVKKLTGS
ncbi:MAG TPA: hypothetical protein VGL72_02165, partial [Bryobacteraceae bacterium]